MIVVVGKGVILQCERI